MRILSLIPERIKNIEREITVISRKVISSSLERMTVSAIIIAPVFLLPHGARIQGYRVVMANLVSSADSFTGNPRTGRHEYQLIWFLKFIRIRMAGISTQTPVNTRFMYAFPAKEILF